MSVVLVTGGAQGIGRGIASRFLRREEGGSGGPWRVAVVDRDPQGVADFERFLDSNSIPRDSTRLLTHVADVARQSNAKAVVERVVQHFGRLDVLVNNAGGGGLGMALDDVTEESWDAIIDANLTSAFFMSQAASPFLALHRGSIINVSSTRAVMSEPNSFAYSASKGGVESLTHSLAASLAGRVNVNCLRIGWVDVSGPEWGAGRTQVTLSKKDHEQHFSGRVGTPDDVADSIRFLIDAKFVSGQCLTLDGGMTKKMIYCE